MKNFLALLVFCLAIGGAQAQILPPDADQPVEVRGGTGTLAERLAGRTMPRGKGWKSAMDRERLVQISYPEKWKLTHQPEGAVILRLTAPDSKEPPVTFDIHFEHPADQDPLQVDEAFARSYAARLAELPDLKRLQFRLTEQGLISMRGMKMVLAGGTATVPQGKKEIQVRQAQVTYIDEDRLIIMQFICPASRWENYVDSLAGMIASYMTIGRKAPSADPLQDN